MPMKCFPIRIDDKTLDKLHVVANYEGRNANGQVLALIRDAIKRYEAQNGTITLNDPNEMHDRRKKR